MNENDKSKEKLINLLKIIRQDLIDHKEIMYKISEKDVSNRILSYKIANIFGYMEFMCSAIEDNAKDIKELTNALKELPNREEFEETKSIALRIEQKAEKSLNAIKKAMDLHKSKTSGEDIYG